jgi:hypothetical protein
MRLTRPLTQPLTRRLSDPPGFVLAAPTAPAVFPQPGVAVDLDFIGRRYYWNGAQRTEADFTSFVLNGATFGAQGLDISTCSVNPDITITLAALGLAMPPCVYAVGGYVVSNPAGNKGFVHFDGGAVAERFYTLMAPGPNLTAGVVAGNVSQSSQGLNPVVAVRFGIAISAQLNDVKFSGDGVAVGADTVATMPTVTTLRLGATPATAGTFPPGILSRLWIYSAVKTQAEINAISTQIRDAPATPAWMWPGAAVDFDFIRRRYYWNGLTRSEANFTTLVLNGATWGAQGLDFSTCTVNPNITITLAALGIAMPPCVFAMAGYFLSTPAATKAFFEFDDGTLNERFVVNLVVNPLVNLQVIDGNVGQSVQNPGTINTPSVRFGIAFSAQLNEVLAAGNGIAVGADTVATMPTVTTLRLGCNAAAGTFPPAILSRLVIFTAVKTQPQVNQLSIDIRDAA